jgi:hypothetical protein
VLSGSTRGISFSEIYVPGACNVRGIFVWCDRRGRGLVFVFVIFCYGKLLLVFAATGLSSQR